MIALPSSDAAHARQTNSSVSTVAALAETVTGAHVEGDRQTIISDLAYDSRAVRPGTLFFCVPGARSDGHAFAADAVRSGASALVVERDIDATVPRIHVPSVRAAMGPMAAAFFGEPSRAMTLVGATGTNGKTTTTFMLESVLRAMDLRAGLIGTVETHLADVVEPVTRTTPEAIDLQRLLARMRDAGVRAAAMEVSSEGLHFERVESTRFACSIFTNLSQDHLNTHGTMEAYFEAKALLFRPAMSARAVANIGDPSGARLAAAIEIPCTTYAIDAGADVRAERIELAPRSVRFDAITGADRIPLRIELPALHNVENALAVVATAVAMAWPMDAVVAGLGALRGVPGRLEPVDAGQDFTVLVDYAHTPDSLENVLRAARAFTPGGARLIAVFGCGGDRDRGKRPQMGRVAVELADHTIITSDNPRTEEPGAIIAEIEAGARAAGGSYDVEPDRRAAIVRAVAGARSGDVIVIAGKGHETGQQFADGTVPFDDRIVAREALEAR